MVLLGGVLVDGFRNVVFTVPESLPANKIMKKQSYLNLRKTTKDVKRQKQEQKLGS